ncbi:hypothetical protein BC828DRAFT_10111 [Blastocladiella britannica]|nr:hypothetical protein BC828DRAFT_10111 [Blastocladiella britannica]
MLESTPWMTPDVIRSVGRYSALFALAVLAVIAQLALICVRVDGHLGTASWHLVLIPIYLVVGLVWCASAWAAVAPSAKSAAAADRRRRHASRYGGTDAETAREAHHDSDAEGSDDELPEAPRALKVAGFVLVSALAAFTVLAGALANGEVAAWILMFPLAVLALYAAVPSAAAALVMVVPGPATAAAEEGADPDAPPTFSMVPAPASQRAIAFVLALCPLILTVTQGALIAAKIDGGLSDAAWGLVFLPSYMFPLVALAESRAEAATINAVRAVHPNADPESLPSPPSMFGTIVGIIFRGAFTYTTLGLIIAKLQSGSPMLAVAVIPVWITLIVLALLFGCCVPCVTSGILPDADASGLGHLSRAAAAAVPVARRIEYRTGSSHSLHAISTATPLAGASATAASSSGHSLADRAAASTEQLMAK